MIWSEDYAILQYHELIERVAARFTAPDETGGMTIEELIPEAIAEWEQVRDS